MSKLIMILSLFTALCAFGEQNIQDIDIFALAPQAYTDPGQIKSILESVDQSCTITYFGTETREYALKNEIPISELRITNMSMGAKGIKAIFKRYTYTDKNTGELKEIADNGPGIICSRRQAARRVSNRSN